VPVPTNPFAPTDAPVPIIDSVAAVHFDGKDRFTIMLIGVGAREGACGLHPCDQTTG
jgi:hypothetical protein